MPVDPTDIKMNTFLKEWIPASYPRWSTPCIPLILYHLFVYYVAIKHATFVSIFGTLQ